MRRWGLDVWLKKERKDKEGTKKNVKKVQKKKRGKQATNAGGEIGTNSEEKAKRRCAPWAAKKLQMSREVETDGQNRGEGKEREMVKTW